MGSEACEKARRRPGATVSLPTLLPEVCPPTPVSSTLDESSDVIGEVMLYSQLSTKVQVHSFPFNSNEL